MPDEMSPQLPPEEIRDRIQHRVSRLDRSVFDELLTEALACKPTPEAWQKAANENPARYMQAVANVAQLRGFTAKTEHVTKKLDITELARLLIAQKGHDNARTVLEAMGAPTAVLAICAQPERLPHVRDAEDLPE